MEHNKGKSIREQMQERHPQLFEGKLTMKILEDFINDLAEESKKSGQHLEAEILKSPEFDMIMRQRFKEYEEGQNKDQGI